jgi:apolipoprotein N-acyltransferase
LKSIKRSPFSLPLLSGALLVLIQPPVSLSYLAFFALIPLFYSLDEGSFRRSLISGYITGVACYLGLIYWVIVAMHKYGGINIYLSFLILMLFVFYMATYTACFALGIMFLQNKFSIPFYLTAPPIWIMLEYLRGALLTGFPWSFLAHSQYNFLPFIQVASITGTYFISFLIVAVNAIAFTLLRRRKISLVYSAVIFVLLLSSITYGIAKLHSQDSGGLKAAIIQGNIAQDVKWDEAFKVKTVNTYYQATVNTDKDVNIVVWPETAIPVIFDQEPNVKTYIGSLPSITGALLLFGTVSRTADNRLYNSAYVLGPDNREEGRYSKGHLVPFGEYTPLRSWLSFLEKLSEKLSMQVGEFFPGENHEPVCTDKGRIGMLICYEGVFPYITRETVQRGAQVLVNITNDAWYDRTSAPYQHLAFYVFRAVESDRFVLRAANTGISAIIDPQGRIRKKTPIFEPAVLTGEFTLKETKTLYIRYGDYFVTLCVIFLAALILASPKVRAYRRRP